MFAIYSLLKSFFLHHCRIISKSFHHHFTISICSYIFQTVFFALKKKLKRSPQKNRANRRNRFPDPNRLLKGWNLGFLGNSQNAVMSRNGLLKTLKWKSYIIPWSWSVTIFFPGSPKEPPFFSPPVGSRGSPFVCTSKKVYHHPKGTSIFWKVATTSRDLLKFPSKDGIVFPVGVYIFHQQFQGTYTTLMVDLTSRDKFWEKNCPCPGNNFPYKPWDGRFTLQETRKHTVSHRFREVWKIIDSKVWDGIS